MAKDRRDRFDLLSELKGLVEQSDSASPDKKNADAKFEANSLEKRILYSATWVDADAEDGDENIITGTKGRDNLTGTVGRDIMDGLTGNDSLAAGAGNDEVYGGSGRDYLQGDAGDDQIYGGNGQDVLVGGSGDDQLFGGTGSDTLDGGEGQDRIDGGRGKDVVNYSGNRNDYAITSNDNGSFTISDSRGIDGTDTVTNVELFQFADGLVSSQDLLNDVTDVNESPDTQGENYTVHEDHSVTGNVLQNDSDVDGDNLTVSSYSQPTNGSVTIDAKGDFQYQPDANFSGSDSFTYTVSDGNGGFATETVTIKVEAVADVADLDVQDATGNEDTAIQLDINASLIDADGSESISDITISGVPSGATLSAGSDNGDGTWSLDAGDLNGLSITPAENNNDDFDLTVEVTTIDGSDSASISQTLHVDVNAVNDAVNDLSVSGQSVAENAPAGTVVGTLTASDIDANESFTYEIVDGNGNAVQDANFEIVGDEIRVKDGADLNYEASSSHQLNIRVTDSAGAQHIESITIDVTDVNESPDTQGENYTVHEDHSVTGNVLQNDSDVDGDNLTVSSYSQPTNGSVTIDAKGDFQYQPDANFSGSDSFTYTVSDGNGGFATETVTIKVEAVADVADLDVQDATGNEDTAIQLDINASLIDADGSESISDITISGVPSGATLSAGSDNGDGTWSLDAGDLNGLSITPAENNNDDFDLTVEVTTIDGSDSASISQTLHVDVNAVNDAVNDLSVSGQSVAENAPAGTVVGTLTASDIDANESFTYEIVDGNGNAVQDANFEIVGDEIRVKDGADLNYEASSSHQLNIRVTDSAGAQHIESITIDVTDVNESPDTQGENYTVHEDHSVTGNVLQNDSDVDGDNLTVSSYSQPTNGSVTIDAKGDFQYQPDANFSGSDSFTYTVSDGNGGFATETVTIKVEAVADVADLDVQDATGNEDTAIQLDINASLIDADGSESISDITISGVPSGATLSAGSDNGDGTWSLDAGDLNGLSITPAGKQQRRL